MEPYYNDVNDWLLVGGDLDLAHYLTGMSDKETIEYLRGLGVTHVLDARSEWTDADIWLAEGLPAENYAHLPIIDSWNHRPDEEWFCGVENFVLDFLTGRSEGTKLYVHCHMGVNRGPSAAMLALLTADPMMSPWDAFLTIRDRRPAAGVVYADHVGVRHIVRTNVDDEITWAAMGEFRKQIRDYWNPSLITGVNRGVAYYRKAEGGTVVVAN